MGVEANKKCTVYGRPVERSKTCFTYVCTNVPPSTWTNTQGVPSSRGKGCYIFVCSSQFAYRTTMKGRAGAQCLLTLLAVGLAIIAANAVTIRQTNKDRQNMPMVPVKEADKPISGFYEPIGQAPIAVAHSMQLPCGNKFLMMVSATHDALCTVCTLTCTAGWVHALSTTSGVLSHTYCHTHFGAAGPVCSQHYQRTDSLMAHC